MNREIEFRGHNGVKWIYSECIWYNRFPSLNDIQICMYDEDDNRQNELDIETWDNVCYVGQYTGFKDINGVKIYEGDICKFFSLFQDKYIKRVVEFKEGIWIIGDHGLYQKRNDIKVVGNKYEEQG